MLKIKSKSPKKGATILTSKDYQAPRTLPDSWRQAAGILKGKFTEDPVAWQRRIRKESDKHRNEQIRLVIQSDNR